MSESFPTPAEIWQTLGTIPDPEFGVSLVDLGLIYSVECAEGNARVIMTLTTPTCPSGGWMVQGVEQALRAMSGVRDARVDLVFEPPWNPSMLSVEGRHQLGWKDESAALG